MLGYIFEKYINQKAFGAYYTRREITDYLCERSIHAVILERVNEHVPRSGHRVREFTDYRDLLLRLDADLCRILLHEVLPRLSILDPACGSGAFLVAAMKNLLNIYGAVYGRIEVLNDPTLSARLRDIRSEHASPNYHIRKQIITQNLYGVDVMDEATEIARLRLFLALVSSAQSEAQLEPLPNIDFNIMAGNSLIGLLSVDDRRFDERARMDYMFQGEAAANWRRLLAEKNRAIESYRFTATLYDDLHSLRRRIDGLREGAYKALNDILLDDFRALKIQYEEAQLKGRAKKRPLETADIEALTPFHWGYEFDRIVEERGGFDVIITNPPWEAFKPQDKEFFTQHSDQVTINKMRITDFRRLKTQLLQEDSIREGYLQYLSGYRHVSAYYRNTPQYGNQISRVDGRKQGTDINLYKLFTEQCANLLRDGGNCGIVIPSGIYTDLGTKQLREMLFEETEISGIFGFENRKAIFEGVHRSFKFIVLTFVKGGCTQEFPAAFMRHDVGELEGFPAEDAVRIGVDLVRRSSPTSLSVTEFKSRLDLQIAEKMLVFPLLGDERHGTWNVKLSREFDMANDSDLFHDAPARGRLPLYEGKMIWQFEHGYAEPRYWIEEVEGRQRAVGRRATDTGQILHYQQYRLGYRAIARSTDTRTLVSSIIPPTFAGHSLIVTLPMPNNAALYLSTALNSFVMDWQLRLNVSANVTMFFVRQLPIPRLMPGDPYFDSIVRRAAQLICTTMEFDDLAAEVGLESHRNGVTDPAQRARLRAELDGIVARIYGLDEEEFRHVLSTFPLVAQEVKDAALQAWRDVGAGVVR